VGGRCGSGRDWLTNRGRLVLRWPLAGLFGALGVALSADSRAARRRPEWEQAPEAEAVAGGGLQADSSNRGYHPPGAGTAKNPYNQVPADLTPARSRHPSRQQARARPRGWRPCVRRIRGPHHGWRRQRGPDLRGPIVDRQFRSRHGSADWGVLRARRQRTNGMSVLRKDSWKTHRFYYCSIL